MPLYPLESKHKFFFDWFEDKRKKDGLYYSVRKQDGDRLQHGYIFLGSDYIGIPLVNHGDKAHRTASVQFVYDKVLNGYCLEVVSRNLSLPQYKDSETEKEFCEKVKAFIELIYEYAKKNGGRVLNPSENRNLSSSKHLLKPANVKESLFVANHPSQHKPENNEYQAKLFFNETTPEAALEKFYAFWKEHGISYWSNYFRNPADTIEAINNSLGKIDHSLAQCNWPLKVD